MSSNLSKKELNHKESAPEGWDGAILEAKRQIQMAKQRIATLKFTIKTFEHLKEIGAPFPSEQAKPQSQKEKQNVARFTPNVGAFSAEMCEERSGRPLGDTVESVGPKSKATNCSSVNNQSSGDIDPKP